MKQKEIWLISLDPTIGAEIKKTRPCVILNDKYKDVPWMVKLSPDRVNNLDKVSVIDVFQVRSVSEERLIKKVGSIKEEHLLQVKEALKTIFGIV